MKKAIFWGIFTGLFLGALIMYWFLRLIYPTI